MREGKKREHPRAWLYRGVNGGEHKASPRLHARPRSFTVPLFMLITSKWSQIHGTEYRRWSGSGLVALAKYGRREGGGGGKDRVDSRIFLVVQGRRVG